MCETLAAALPEPVPFAHLADYAADLERFGLGGWGWGVAWLDEDDGRIKVVRDTGRFVDQGRGDERLLRLRSRRFLVHLRRPSRLSTVAMADTQPFVAKGRYAFCHNGFLERAEQLRPRYADKLAGRADSEVGWVFFDEQLAAGVSPETALRQVDEAFGGNVNLGYLGEDGTVAVYSQNKENAIWQFRLGDADVAATALHSADESLFSLVFPSATDRRQIERATGSVIAGRLDGAPDGSLLTASVASDDKE